jgi:hypothetical protein
MFSATVMTGMSMKCWCTMPIPVDDDVPAVRVVEPVQNAHEGRLAGAVLAEQSVHLALSQVEVDSIVGEHPGELLRDLAQLEDEFRVWHWQRILRLGPISRTKRAGPEARPLVAHLDRGLRPWSAA